LSEEFCIAKREVIQCCVLFLKIINIHVNFPASTPDKGPLSSPAALAGADTPRDESLQHLLSDQLETVRVREKALDRELKALPTLTIRGEEMFDPRLAAWMECGKISRTFAYDYPNNFHLRPLMR
jgi:hypothetical protein